MEEMNLAQSNNEVVIEGILSEVDLVEGKTQDGREYIRGNIIVAVDQEVEKVPEHDDVRVDMIAMKYKTNGEPNPAFKSIKDVLNLRRISTDGEAADRVRVRGCRIEENVFEPAGSTDRVFGWKISGSFVSKVTGEFKPKAVFKNEIYLRSIEDEVDSSGEETGRLILKGFSVGYKNRLDMLKFAVGLPKAVDFIKKNWDIDSSVKVEGYIRNRFVEKSTTDEIEDGFGEAIDFGGSGVQRELVITRGGPVDRGWEEDDLRRAAAMREERIETEIAKAKASRQKKANASSAAKKAPRSW